MLAAKRAKRAAYMRAYRKRKREETDEITISKQGNIGAERKHYPKEHSRHQFGDVRRSNAEYMRAYRKRKAEQRNAEYSCIPLLIQASMLEPLVQVEIKEEPFFLEQSPIDLRLDSEKFKPLMNDKKKEEDECGHSAAPPDGLALKVAPDREEQKIYSTDGHTKSEISIKIIS